MQLVREKLGNLSKTVSYYTDWQDRELFVWSREQLSRQEWARKLIKLYEISKINIISKLNELV
jgi:hypothetical protein